MNGGDPQVATDAEIFAEYCADLTVNNFLDFIVRQPQDRVIIHNAGWEACAIGEFVMDIFGDSYLEAGSEVHHDACGNFCEELNTEFDQLLTALDHGDDFSIIDASGDHNIDSYGALYNYIQTLEY